MLVSAIYQHESVIYMFIYPLPLEPPSHLPPHTTPLGCHRALDLGSLHHTGNSHWPSILHMVNVYVSMLLSQIIPASPYPTVSKSFDDGYSGQCEVIPHCSFDSHFSISLLINITAYLILQMLTVSLNMVFLIASDHSVNSLKSLSTWVLFFFFIKAKNFLIFLSFHKTSFVDILQIIPDLLPEILGILDLFVFHPLQYKQSN